MLASHATGYAPRNPTDHDYERVDCSLDGFRRAILICGRRSRGDTNCAQKVHQLRQTANKVSARWLFSVVFIRGNVSIPVLEPGHTARVRS